MNNNRYSVIAHGLAIALALFLASGSALADEAVDDKVVIDLTGAWEMEGVLPVLEGLYDLWRETCQFLARKHRDRRASQLEQSH